MVSNIQFRLYRQNCDCSLKIWKEVKGANKCSYLFDKKITFYWKKFEFSLFSKKSVIGYVANLMNQYRSY